MSSRFSNFFRAHWMALALAVVVGLIYLIPNVFFILSLGDAYQGIPMLNTANEDFYLARVQEIIDGHPFVSSFSFYEGKDELPVQPPTVEFLYALPTLAFGISPTSTLVASKFILPAVLFLLVYFLIRGLTGADSSFANKFNAVAGAIFVTLGYDLIEYRNLPLIFSGEWSPGGFLIWARPVNPIFGAIFLFSFLLFLRVLVYGTEWKKTSIFGASLFLALAMSSYFFSWGLAVSVLAFLFLIYLVKKEYAILKNLTLVLLLALLLSSPYWYINWQASQADGHAETLLRNGLFYTHYPLFNKLLFAVFVFYLVAVFWAKKFALKIGEWHWFLLALILGSFWALNQQILTGITVWPYHFVQYTIPFAIIVGVVLLYNVFKKSSVFLWGGVISIIFFASAAYGVWAQASAYNNSYEYYLDLQKRAGVFSWLNDQEKDCVVLVNEDNEEVSEFAKLIPALTHCNLYASSWGDAKMDIGRAYHSYLTVLRLKGVSAGEVAEHVAQNKDEAKTYLFSNWKGLYGVRDFPDFSDPLMEKRIEEFPENYREFLEKDFREELARYRLDYILSFGNLNDNIIEELRIEKIFEDSKTKAVIYAF